MRRSESSPAGRRSTVASTPSSARSLAIGLPAPGTAILEAQPARKSGHGSRRNPATSGAGRRSLLRPSPSTVAGRATSGTSRRTPVFGVSHWSGRWREGTARLVPGDDPRERLRYVAARRPIAELNAATVRLMQTALLTIRIDLDGEGRGSPTSASPPASPCVSPAPVMLLGADRRPGAAGVARAERAGRVDGRELPPLQARAGGTVHRRRCRAARRPPDPGLIFLGGILALTLRPKDSRPAGARPQPPAGREVSPSTPATARAASSSSCGAWPASAITAPSSAPDERQRDRPGGRARVESTRPCAPR